jgi:magnesium-transporting ATPase (P-type)
MNKPTKIAWGIATVLPLLMTILGIVLFVVFIITKLPELDKHATPSPELPQQFLMGFLFIYGLILAGVGLAYLIVISYFIHMVRTERLDKDQRTLWAVFFVVFRTLAMIVYWFIHVWPEEEAVGKATSARRGRKG